MRGVKASTQMNNLGAKPEVAARGDGNDVSMKLK